MGAYELWYWWEVVSWGCLFLASAFTEFLPSSVSWPAVFFLTASSERCLGSQPRLPPTMSITVMLSPLSSMCYSSGCANPHTTPPCPLFRATGHLRMPFCDLLVWGRTVARLLSQALFPWICLAAISSLCRGYFYEACLTLDFILVAKCRSFLQLGFSTCLGFHKCLCPVRDPELDRRRGELWRAEPFLGIRLPPPVLLPKTSLLIAPTLIHTGCEYIAGVGRQGLTHSLSSL